MATIMENQYADTVQEQKVVFSEKQVTKVEMDVDIPSRVALKTVTTSSVDDVTNPVLFTCPVVDVQSDEVVLHNQAVENAENARNGRICFWISFSLFAGACLAVWLGHIFSH